MYKSAIITTLSLVCLVASGQSANAPVILNHSLTANAGDVLYFQAAGIGANPQVQYSYNGPGWINLPVLETSVPNGVIMAQVPTTELRLPDLFDVRVSPDGVTWSVPVYLNVARATSFDTDQVAPGSPFRVWGRNLYLGHTPTIRFVDQTSGAQSFATVNIAASSSKCLTATAPVGIVAGDMYQVYVSNGLIGDGTTPMETLAEETLLGRSAGVDYWSLGIPWAADLNFYGNVYNIQTDARLTLHANGQGNVGDITAIQNAINVATSAGGGVVLLPAGIYNLNFTNDCGLSIYPRVVIQGAGQMLTTVNYGFGPVPSNGGYAACFAAQTGMADLTMNNVNQSGGWPQSGFSNGSQEVFLQRIGWHIGTSQWITLNSMKYLTIQNSSIDQGVDSAFNYNGILDLAASSQVRVIGNTLEYVVGGILLDSTTDLSFENNTVNRKASQVILGQCCTHNIEANFAKDFVVLSNSFNVINGVLAVGDTNGGEVLNTEGGDGIRFNEFRGIVSSSAATTVTDGGQNFGQSTNYNPALQVGAIVAIVSGIGNGQWRTVTGVSSDEQTITVDSAWAVLPEAGAHYATFDWSAVNWIVANNQMTGNKKGIEFFNASAHNILVDSNILTDNSGIMLSPEEYPPALFNVISDFAVLNNTISDLAGLRPAYITVVPREDAETTSFGTAIIGFEARGNRITAHVPNTFVSNTSLDDSKSLVEGLNCYWQWQSNGNFDAAGAPPSILGAIFQGNMLQNSDTAIFVNSGASQTVFQDTVLVAVGSVITDATISGAASGSTGTMVSGALTSSSAASTSQIAVQVQDSPISGNTIAIGSPITAGLSASLEPSVLGAQSTGGSVDPGSMNWLETPGSGNMSMSVHITPIAQAAGTGTLIVRSSLLAASSFLSFGLSPSNNLTLQYRVGAEGRAETFALPAPSGTSWIRLTKIGDSILPEYSADGTTWTSAHAITITFPTGQYFMGLGNLSEQGQPTTATFDHFLVESTNIVKAQPERH